VAFPEVFKKGGFDAVIGNPPWGSEITKQEKGYLNDNYVNKNGEAESHIYFIERALKILKNENTLGLITPNTWLAVINSKVVRDYLLTQAAFIEIKQLTKYIFDSAPDIVPVIIVIRKGHETKNKCRAFVTEENKITADNFIKAFELINIKQELWEVDKNKVINLYLKPGVKELLDKCKLGRPILKQLCDVVYGIKTGDNSKYLTRNKTANHNVMALKTGELTRYTLTWKNYYLWWCKELAGYRKSEIEKPKIIVQYIRKLSLKRRIIAALDEKGIYYPLNNYSYITTKNDNSIFYILGVLNSSLINFVYANTFIDYNIKPTFIEQLPIPNVGKNNKQLHDHLVKLVKEMLKLNKTPELRQRHAAEIAAIDREIDQLVYRLYGLTPEEIKIVEGA
jgi:hypothetical protein